MSISARHDCVDGDIRCVPWDTDRLGLEVHPRLMGWNCEAEGDMSIVRSTTKHGGTGVTANRRRLLSGLAALGAMAAIVATVVPFSPEASAASATRSVPADLRTPATHDSATPVNKTADLFGDSLGYQAEPYVDWLFTEAGDFTVSNNTFGGTATCDWLSKMATAAAARPGAAILVFSGNSFTPCMQGATIGSPEYYSLYTAYTEQAIAIFSAVGAHVFLVGTPVDESSGTGWHRLDDIYGQLARANRLSVTFVDAGTSVEGPGGGFTWTLPCMSIEPSCGADGTNVVRSPDGIHFCPDGTPATRGVTGPCDVYSPGAFRFALSVVTAVTQSSVPVVARLVRTAR